MMFTQFSGRRIRRQEIGVEILIGELNTELERMARQLSLPGTSILIALLEKPGHYDELSAELKRRLKLRVEEWFFSPQRLNLPDYVLSLSDGEKKVVFASGLEELPEAERAKVYSILNLGREKIGKSRCGLVIWIPKELGNELMRHAPDFWAWVQSAHHLHLPDDELELQKTMAALRLSGEKELDQLRQRYLEYIKTTCRWLDFRGIMQVRTIVRFPLDQLFVPLMGTERRPEIELQEKTSPIALRLMPFAIPLEEAWKKHRFLVILGDPGSGKSTFLKHLALTFALGRTEEKRTPILISIAEYTMARQEHPFSLLEFIAWRFRQEGLPDLTPLFMSDLESGRAIVLLDGLDEVLTRSEREKVAEEVKDLARKYYLSRFIVTSRIAGYDPSFLPGFTVITIEPFEREQIKIFAHNWARAYEAVILKSPLEDSGWPPFPPEVERRIQKRAEDLFQAVTSHPAIERLATNPLLLTILALIHQQGTRLPQQRVELYRLCIETLAETWNLARSISGISLELWLGERRLSAQDVVQILGPVAFWMQENRPGGLIEREKLEELIASALQREIPDREKACKMAKEFVDLMQVQTGLLLEKGLGQFGFMHLSFQEYLAARYATMRKNTFELLKPHLFSPRWREVVLLTAALLGQFSPEMASDFLSQVYEAEVPFGEIREILKWPLLLAARILADDVPVEDMEMARSLLSEFWRLIGSPYKRLRHEASSILELLGPTRYGPQVAELLVEALRNESAEVRSSAAEALGELGKAEPQVIEALTSALKDEDVRVRISAAEALGILGKAEPWVIEALTSALKDEDAEVRSSAAEALGILGKAEPEVIEALTSALRDEDARVRISAALALGELGKAEPQVIEALTSALKDEDVRVRISAAEALGILGKAEPWVIEALTSALKDEDAEVRSSAAEALGILGKAEPEVIEALTSALKDEDVRVRISTTMALRILGKAEPEIIEALTSALKDEDVRVRISTTLALGILGKAEPGVIEALTSALKDEDPGVRISAAWALRILGEVEPEIIEALTSALKDEDAEVRISAALALGILGKAEPEVIEALTSALKDESAGMRISAALALGKLGKAEPEVIEALTSALKDESAGMRISAALALGKLGKAEPQVIEALTSALEDEDAGVRDSAFEALWELAEKEVEAARDG